MSKTKKFLYLKMILIAALILVIATPAFGSTNTARVWVTYKNGQGATVRNALNGMGAQFHYEFDHLNSYVVSVPEKALDSLTRNPHIAGIEVDVERSLIEPKQMALQDLPDLNNPGQTIPYGVDAVQARDVWDSDRDGAIDAGAPTGAGQVVCIIDTGFYSGHEDLSGVNPVDGYSQTGEPFTEDGYGHGTHVAGTVTAMNNDLGVVGVTPGTVSLYIVKIFDNAGNWVSKAHASDLVAAIYKCADNGADIVSMSMGGFNHQPKERAAFDDLYQQGILFVASASNDGHKTYSYPASYDSVISVGAVDINNQWADFSNFNDQVELTAPGVDVLSTVPFLDTSALTVDGVTYNGFQLTYAPSGSATGELADGGLCDSQGDWAGKVVLCLRGDISFYDKLMNVQNSKGIAAVIYNNVPGGFLGTLGEEGDYIFGISLSQEDGQYLVANKLGWEGTVSSEIVWPASGYEAWGGTSMAAPHVSGVAALVWSAYPHLTNIEIRAALDATAFDLGDPGRDVYYGFGLVQAYDAWQYLSSPVHGPKGPGK
ncbi:MAG: S8 family serine peptidase [Anaerolineales bacterium]|nr:S8 family serine peptidase [Anaerolineales bacterium]